MLKDSANSPCRSDAEKIREEVARIFRSPAFDRAPVMRRLLSFLVDQTLTGNGERMKAYTIAIDALGRSEDFDARTDSYPRVQVGRLRTMLDTFYAENGARDRIRIHIPKGAYLVLFHMPEEDAPAPLQTRVIASTTESPKPPKTRNEIWGMAAALLAAGCLALIVWQSLGGLADAGTDGVLQQDAYVSR